MPGPDPTPGAAEDLELLKHAARKAGHVALQHFRTNVAVWNKAPGHPVTEADIAVDTSLATTLRRARPDYGWLSEETAEAHSDRDREHVFVVDPIDGTRSFIRGERYWCIGLAVVRHGHTNAAVVYNPVTEELFEASAGGGARRNGDAISVSNRDVLWGCRLIASQRLVHRKGGPNPWPDMEFADPKPNATLYRLALVACGAWDATVVLWRKSDWDLAPGELLIREAGGLATTHDGETLLFNRLRPVQKSLLAAGPRLHALLKSRLDSVALPDPHREEENAVINPFEPPAQQKPKDPMTQETETKQLLHIVFGGELRDVSEVAFEDLSKVEFVGAFGSYKEAYDAWKAAAQRTVDHAETRFFILHAHKLLDPETGDHHTV